jgi:glycosyltransferase involved in cell wall biosynthesis
MGATLIELIVDRGPMLRYAICIYRTLGYLWAARKSIVVVQNPSLILAMQAVVLKRLLDYRVIVDSHNAGINPAEGKSRILNSLARFVSRLADITLVSNAELASKVTASGGNPIVMPDPLPAMGSQLPEIGDAVVSGRRRALFVCSWASDEPYLHVIEAANLLPDIEFYITGRSKGKEQLYGEKLPKNVHLTGYLPEEEYRSLMKSASIVIDLTTRDDCLVCGAYEAVSVEKPFVLSDTPTIRAYFRKGGVYVANDTNGIVKGIRDITADYGRYQDEVRNFREFIEAEWTENFMNTMRVITKP